MQVLPRIAEEVRAQVRIAAIRASGVVVGPAQAPLALEMDELARAASARHAGAAPAEIPGLRPARELYRAFGVDPTRVRPSSEALLRRVLQGKPLPRISNAVDVCNLCSLTFLLPIGLYDADRVRGEVRLRRGRPAESYPGIRKEDLHLEGRLVLADEEGAFGNPSSDSARTAVGEATERLWMVVFAPSTTPAALLREHARFACSAIERHLRGAREVETRLEIGPDA